MTDKLKKKIQDKKKMGAEVRMESRPPLLRQPDQPMAVLGRSSKSQARASERFKGLSDRTKRQLAYQSGIIPLKGEKKKRK